MENNLKLPKSDEFKFFESAEYNRKIEFAKYKMRPKPFIERFKNLNMFAFFGNFFFPVISILTGITFLYSYIFEAIGYVAVSIAFAVIILSFIELIKNNLLVTGFETYFSNSGKSTLIFIFAFIFSSFSFVMSYQGAELLVQKLDTKKETIKVNSATKIDNIISQNTNQIKAEQSKIDDLKKKLKVNGKA